MNRSFSTTLASDPRFRKRGADARLLYFTLYTHPGNHLCGMFALSVEHMAVDVGISVERTQAALAELVKYGLTQVDPDQDLVWLPDMAAANATPMIKNPLGTVYRSCDKYLHSFRPSRICSTVADTLSIPYRYPIDTLSHTVCDTPLLGSELGLETGLGTEASYPPSASNPTHREATNASLAPGSSTSSAPVQGSLLPDPPAPAAPARRTKASPEKTEAKSAATWAAYSAAYAERYRKPPLRNGKLSRQLCELVDQMGADEAPNIAAFYLTRSLPLYVNAFHPVGLLLRDAQALRTQMQTGASAPRTGGLPQPERPGDNILGEMTRRKL